MNYAASNYKEPECVFAPDNARGVAFAVQTFAQTSTKFAVCGGGQYVASMYGLHVRLTLTSCIEI